MNHETTIKRIKELVPSVMELEFGCEVKILISHSVSNRSRGTYWRKHRVIAIHHSSGDLIINRNDQYGNKKISRSSQMQVIGKPITLCHILLAIKTLVCKRCNGNGGTLGIGMGYSECEDCGGDRFDLPDDFAGTEFDLSDILDMWDLTKDNFNDQSEETKTFIGVLIK